MPRHDFVSLSFSTVVIGFSVLSAIAISGLVMSAIVMHDRTNGYQSCSCNSSLLEQRITTLEQNSTVMNIDERLQNIEALDIGEKAGWVNIADTEFTSGSPQLLTATRTPFESNGLGSATNTVYKRNLSMNIFGGSVLMPMTPGVPFHLRLSFKVIPNQANSYILLELDIGPGGVGIPIVARTISLPRGAGIEHSISVAFPIYCLETFVTNGGRLFLTMSTGDTASLYDRSIFILQP